MGRVLLTLLIVIIAVIEGTRPPCAPILLLVLLGGAGGRRAGSKHTRGHPFAIHAKGGARHGLGAEIVPEEDGGGWTAVCADPFDKVVARHTAELVGLVRNVTPKPELAELRVEPRLESLHRALVGLGEDALLNRLLVLGQNATLPHRVVLPHGIRDVLVVLHAQLDEKNDGSFA